MRPCQLPQLTVREGLGVLGPAMTELLLRVDDVLVGWAREWEVDYCLYPPLIPVSDLDAIDYFRNFPHLALCATPVRSEAIEEVRRRDEEPSKSVPSAHLSDGRHVLQSAACYNVYLSLRGERLHRAVHVTTLGNCFRNEERYSGLERLMSFRMREIVCVGPAGAVESHLVRCKQRFVAFTRGLGLDLGVQVATDPFFEQKGARARMQQLFPTKEELVHDDRLAVASVNAHRNFFGERCDIRMADGSFACSGCFGVGLERLAWALASSAGGAEAALDRVRASSS